MAGVQSVNVASARNPGAVVLRYHQDTKHHFFRFARSPGHLDWANQPDPFRRFSGAPVVPLPRLPPGEEPCSPFYADLYRAGAVFPQPVTIRSLSRLFEHTLAITAWKQAGEVRWALRSNPSSGNLHPTEGYLVIGALSGLGARPALYHYAAKDHALERRAEAGDEGFARATRAWPPAAFLMGFSSIHWREAWKYGERAFRYCQHDLGHAIGAARIAAATLGWNLRLLDWMGDDEVARLLGLDREDDFDRAEREYPAGVLAVWPAGPPRARTEAAGGAREAAYAFEAVPLIEWETWRGRANRLSPDDPVPWEIIDEVAAATWKPATLDADRGRSVGRGARNENPPCHGSEPVEPAAVYPNNPTAGQIIHQRRSALAFDGRTTLPADRFYAMLRRVMPCGERAAPERPAPWDAIPWEPTIHLALFVHRIDGLAPGLYCLVRNPADGPSLRAAMHREFLWTEPPGCPDELPLALLQEGDARTLSAQLSCGQDIAAAGVFSLAMVAAFAASVRARGPWFYRRLFWEAGIVGQVLYLEAEAMGVRATGIGCFFDDPVHGTFGLQGWAFQSLYHFTVGGPVEDTRLTTLPAYGGSDG
jgi:SagB-type dehydrogenase family enzyme